MRVSVALCTHQGERYLEEQVRSILAQTHPVHEIVVGDDASTDGTLAILDRLAAGTDVPFHVVRHAPALGVAANFADAIARTSGDVVALSDQDDVWHPDRVERLLPALDGVDLVHTDARIVDASGAPTGSTLLGDLGLSRWERARMMHGGAFEALLRRNLVTGATVLVRRDAAVAALPVPEGWIHDEWLAMVAALGGGVRLVPEPTIDYRQHGGNQIGVRRLSFVGKAGRLLAPFEEAQRRKLLRASSAVERADLDSLGDEAERRALAGKLAHEQHRLRAQLEPAARLHLVVAALAGGGYRRYARGPADAVRDLLARPTSQRRDR